MKIPAITGIIRRRILLNYRVAPEVVETILPVNFRPKLFPWLFDSRYLPDSIGANSTVWYSSIHRYL